VEKELNKLGLKRWHCEDAVTEITVTIP